MPGGFVAYDVQLDGGGGDGSEGRSGDDECKQRRCVDGEGGGHGSEGGGGSGDCGGGDECEQRGGGGVVAARCSGGGCRERLHCGVHWLCAASVHMARCA